MTSRDYDLVLFGATGFTGGLAADYLAEHAPAGCRLALAGRSQGRLEAVRDRMAVVNRAYSDIDLLIADATIADTMREVAGRTRVAISTVGPYIDFGEAFVAACAAAGTDYVDITGEPEFVDRIFVRHHRRARQTGARLVHACGFDSVPYDLGVYFTVGLLPSDGQIHVDGYVRSNASLSGGTLHTAVTAFSRRREIGAAAAARRADERRPPDRRARGSAGRFGRSSTLGGWTVPLPTIDPQIVTRSARTLPRYGPDFTYRHHALVTRLPVAVAGAGAVGSAVLLSQLGPTRRWLMSRMESGAGPSAARRARSWFKVVFVGTGADSAQVMTEFSGGDPGYDETAKMLSESALCLAYDDNPATAGQLTTAVAMGDALLARLRTAGLRIEQTS